MREMLIQCVVVLYRCSFADSDTMTSLAELCVRHSELAQRMALLVYDNSPEPQTEPLDRWSFGAIEYHHAEKNDGLAVAYNRALSMARAGGLEWLLLLDQDTVLNPELMPAMFSTLASAVPTEVCAIVPRLMGEGRLLSPQIVGRLHNVDYPAAETEISRSQVTAFNAAACLRVRAVEAIGGFPGEYWLDYLDHVMFHRLQAAGGRVLILNLVMQHRLSVHSLDTGMSLDRYANLLAAEWRFIRETGTGGGPVVHRLRLLKRALSQRMQLKNKAYAASTLRASWQ